MAVVKEFSVEHCKKVRIHDDQYAHLSEEEIAKRKEDIQRHFNLLVRQQFESGN